ncbi:hypothetical protein B0J18DRAFT_406506 [Chaetomium sp. MPI-SDFR-AT-0129]|nr:hypothetical protein B0J18DRAFT_406506 [Chaetomium sp. MPI-SDFR-AT-0129]
MAGGVALMASPAGVALPVLNVVGFGSGGVAAGSIAASIQSGIGSVVGGSAFAVCQSAAAGGAGAAAVNGVVAGAGAAVSAAAVGGRFLVSKLSRGGLGLKY